MQHIRIYRRTAYQYGKISIAQYRYAGLGCKHITNGDGLVYDLLKVGMHSRFSIARKGYNVGQSSLRGHLCQLVLQSCYHIFCAIELRLNPLQRPAALAIDALEATELVVQWEQIDTQRES